MKKLIAESLVIFVSIMASFNLDNYQKEQKKIEDLNRSIKTLSGEMMSNLEYTKEHQYQLKNMLKMTNYILDNFSVYKKSDLRKLHDENPFIHKYGADNTTEYSSAHSDFDDKSYFFWTNSWKPDDLYFNSLLYSGELLNISDEKLVNQIESIYTKQQERMNGIGNLRTGITKKLKNWETKKEIESSSCKNPLFDCRDSELKTLLKWRKFYLEASVSNIQKYGETLESTIKIINPNE